MPGRRRPFDPGRRRVLVGAGIAAAVVMGASFTGTFSFRVSRHRLALPGLAAPVRLALLTDLHVGRFVSLAEVRAWVAATRRETPEVVVLAGDLVDAQADRRDGTLAAQLAAALAPLRPPLGSFAVWGNHDHRHFRDPAGLSAFASELERHGIRVLTNAHVDLRDDLVLAGIDDLRLGRPDLAAALANRAPGGCTLLASHTPDILPEVPPGEVALTLAGHTHGGQVCLPGIGPLVTNSRYGQRFAAGLVRGPALGYVSRGLGVSGLPLRVDCPAELAILDLVPATDA